MLDFLVLFVFDFLGLYYFFWVLFFCVLDEEDVRSKFMCFLFLGIITVNPPEVRPVFALPTRGLKLITLPT